MHAGPSLTLAPISADADEIVGLYRDPYVARVADDDAPAEPLTSGAYLGAWVDRAFVGAYLLIESAARCVDVHSLLTRAALPYCRLLGRICLDCVFSQSAAYRVTAYVREDLVSALNYCRRLGFVAEGVMRDACRKHGRLMGVHVLGMTRADWAASAARGA